MKDNLNKNIARLESKLDFLESEWRGLDGLLKKSGFTNGIDTLKKAMEELLPGSNRRESYEDTDELDELFD